MGIQCAPFEVEIEILWPILFILFLCSQALKSTKNWADTVVGSALQLIWRVLEEGRLRFYDRD